MRNQQLGRTRQFADFLATLSPEELHRIENNERLYLAQREAPFSTQRRAVKDFCSVMVGAREEV
jgi:hypothetical protein